MNLALLFSSYGQLSRHLGVSSIRRALDGPRFGSGPKRQEHGPIHTAEVSILDIQVPKTCDRAAFTSLRRKKASFSKSAHIRRLVKWLSFV